MSTRKPVHKPPAAKPKPAVKRLRTVAAGTQKGAEPAKTAPKAAKRAEKTPVLAKRNKRNTPAVAAARPKARATPTQGKPAPAPGPPFAPAAKPAQASRRASTPPAPPPAEPSAARGPGQPPHVPTELSQAQVTAWSGGGIEQDTIASSLKISTPTLVKHYAVQLAAGKGTMDGLAISTLALAMRRGGKEAVTAAKWWTQSRMGWTERLIVEDPHADTPMRVIIELVGDAPDAASGGKAAKPRPGYDRSMLDLMG